MRPLPRLAVGTVQTEAHREPVLWGLLSALHQLGASPALFRSSCRMTAGDAAKAITGVPTRHLDSWAMSRHGVLQTLAHSVSAREVAVVEGHFAPSAAAGVGGPPASRLETLCEWLDLPRIAIVDVRRLAMCQPPLCQFSQRQSFDGLLLDRVANPRDAAYWRTTLETLWGAPVLGCLGEAPQIRALCDTLPAGRNPSPELCRALATRLLPSLDVETLLSLACRTPSLAIEPELSFLHPSSRKFRIAVAYDEAYCGYYPETLDLLEAAGAELCDFSPLTSGSLPADTDIVYFGCGHPERHAEQLAGNHCLKQSLRCFAAAGGRVYAEGSGLAYVCREIVFPCGTAAPMTGLLPATARWLPQATASEPTEIEFGASSWLCPARTSLRGYRHTGWQIEPRGPMHTYARDTRQRLDVLGRGNVIGSRVLINLAANRHLLSRFFQPYAPVGQA